MKRHTELCTIRERGGTWTSIRTSVEGAVGVVVVGIGVRGGLVLDDALSDREIVAAPVLLENGAASSRKCQGNKTGAKRKR